MALRDFFPSIRSTPIVEAPKTAVILPPEDKDKLSGALKATVVAAGFFGLPWLANNQRSAFEQAPYDFDRIIRAIDTDSYAKQAMAKWRELFWKEGWLLTGENDQAVNYIYQRFDFMEIAMNRPLQDFLADVVDQLVRFHNAFIVRSRSSLLYDVFPQRLIPAKGKDPIVGYYIIPTEQVEVLRDKNNTPIKYRQRSPEGSSWTTSSSSDTNPIWLAEDVIHLYRDRKPGRAFGTPFLTSALEDIQALRQIEEDIQNLIHRELFPLYVYKVGTPDLLPQPEDIQKAAVALSGLRTEGGLVMPGTHEVDVLGAKNKALDASLYIDHFKERVANGLGVYPHHLGMASEANRSAVDRLDVALYDKVKEYQRYFASVMKLFVLDELLREGGYDPMTIPGATGESDRCLMKFNEIDADTQAKKEALVIQKVQANLTTIPEARLELGLDPDMDESQTIMAKTTQSAMDQATHSAALAPAPAPNAQGKSPTPTVKPSSAVPMAHKPPPAQFIPKNKGASNIVRPANQHGTRTSPNIRHNTQDDLVLQEMIQLIDDPIEEEEM